MLEIIAEAVPTGESRPASPIDSRQLSNCDQIQEKSLGTRSRLSSVARDTNTSRTGGFFPSWQ